jgi:hypothetical protein
MSTKFSSCGAGLSCSVCHSSFTDKQLLKLHLKQQGHYAAPKIDQADMHKQQPLPHGKQQLVLAHDKRRPAEAEALMGALQLVDPVTQLALLGPKPFQREVEFKQEIGETEKRVPVVVHAFIDVSGSMAGSRINQAKKSLHALIDELGPNDALTLHTFANTVKPLMSPVKDQPLAGKKVNLERLQVTQAIDAIQPSGGTALYQAMCEGAACVKRSRKANVDKRLTFSLGGPEGGKLAAAAAALGSASAQNLRQAHQAARHEKLVIITDGDDSFNGQHSSLEEAVKALKKPLSHEQDYEVYVLAVGDAASPGSCMNRIAQSLPDKMEVVLAQDADSITEGFAKIRKKIFRHMKLSIQAWSDQTSGPFVRPQKHKALDQQHAPRAPHASLSVSSAGAQAKPPKPPKHLVSCKNQRPKGLPCAFPGCGFRHD